MIMKNKLYNIFIDQFIPNFIKISAILVALPRLSIAMLRAEGYLGIPDSWQFFWLPMSFVFSVGLSCIEGLSFAFIFNQWKNEKDPQRSKILFIFSAIALLTFCLMVTPSVSASVINRSLSDVLTQPNLVSWPLWCWSFLVVFSTIVIVASVGYSQKSEGNKLKSKIKQSNENKPKGRRGRPKKIIGGESL